MALLYQFSYLVNTFLYFIVLYTFIFLLPLLHFCIYYATYVSSQIHSTSHTTALIRTDQHHRRRCPRHARSIDGTLDERADRSEYGSAIRRQIPLSGMTLIFWWIIQVDIFANPDVPRCDDPGEASELVSISICWDCIILGSEYITPRLVCWLSIGQSECQYA